MKVMAFDPGVTTGYAVTEDFESYFTNQVDCSKMSYLDDILFLEAPDIICYEDFKHRPNIMKAELYSKEVIGVIRLYAEKYNTPIALTPLPSEAKAFWSDSKIKSLHLWKPGQIHAMDALRVLLLYKSKTDLEWYQKTLHKLLSN